MSSSKKAGFGTRAIHAGYDPYSQLGAVNPPVYLTSTYAQRLPGQHQGYEYSRTGNPTRTALEAQIAELEGAERAFAFGSGLAATDGVMKALTKPGDVVVCGDDVYGGTFRIFDKTFEKYGVRFVYVDASKPAEVERAAKGARLVWIETPSNPLLKISDIGRIAKVAHAAGALLCVDNTFATPWLQTPLALGADVVIHSATKYLGGHSDVVLGVVACNDRARVELYKIGEKSLGDAIAFHQNATGGIPGPLDCYLVHRGIKTLELRMERHCANAEKVATFLSSHKRVSRICYPGLANDPGHEVAKAQMRAYGGMVSFEIRGSVEDGVKVVSGRRFWTLGESLGGVESLIEHPCSMTHASVPREKRLAAGLQDGLIRCSVGIENAQDLIDDLAEGLAS